jgi:hypothetical protein
MKNVTMEPVVVYGPKVVETHVTKEPVEINGRVIYVEVTREELKPRVIYVEVTREQAEPREVYVEVTPVPTLIAPRHELPGYGLDDMSNPAQRAELCHQAASALDSFLRRYGEALSVVGDDPGRFNAVVKRLRRLAARQPAIHRRHDAAAQVY